jgi:hypothetical protein
LISENRSPSLQTVLPFKLAATDEALTAHGGLALVGEYVRAMGICSLIDHELPRPGSAAGYNPSAHVLPLVLMLARRRTDAGGPAGAASPRPFWHDSQLCYLLEDREIIG